MHQSRQDRLFRITCLLGALSRRANLPIQITEPVHLAHYSGQDNFVIYAVTGPEQTVEGKLEYAVFEGKAHIAWIEVTPEYQRQGVARQMFEKLQENFPYGEIDWGWLTPSGSKLKKHLDQEHR